MNTARHSILAAIAALLVSGCASDIPYRALPAEAQKWEHCTVQNGCEDVASVQLSEFTAEDKATGGSVKGNYLLGFVEFDDQGWYHRPEQATSLFKAIRAYREQHEGTNFLIVTFAHGWKHNASPQDDNVREFRKLLERLELMEQRQAARQGTKARKVVGVYVGWRGASMTLPLLENLTFWTRKNAGERVGDGSVKQFLMELNEFRAYLNNWDTSERLALSHESQLIMIGHSFGGMLMYHSLYSGLMERALRVRKLPQGDYAYHTAKSFGDFVLLVNPAFEGSTFEPLWNAAKFRNCYSSVQRPALAVVTSKGDWATGVAFPLGRLYTVTQSAPQDGERATVMHTVGHLDRYTTHDLKLAEGQPAPIPVRTEKLSPTSTAQVDKLLGEFSKTTSLLSGAKDTETRYDGARLVSRGNGPANFPYLVVSADKDIIKDHNDIWNDRFADFMVSFIAQEVTRPWPAKVPAEAAPKCVPFGMEAASAKPGNPAGH